MSRSRCKQELCRQWAGDGDVCPCAIFDMAPPGPGQSPEWGAECATCGVKPRRTDDIFCSDDCAGNDWLGQPDPSEQYDRDGLFR